MQAIGGFLTHTDMVEVVEANVAKANDYLRHGYRLMGVYPIAIVEHPKDTNIQSYVRKRVIYVLGRTAETEHYAPPTPNGVAG